MRKVFKFVAALAAVMFAGCTNDSSKDVITPIEGEITVVGVGFDETKTYLGEFVEGVSGKVYWSEGDQIAINGNTSSKIEISENKKFAEFTFVGSLNYPYSVLYPASAYIDASTINLPAVQAAADGTFATNCAPMACVAEEGDGVALHHLTSVVHLKVVLPAESTHATHKLTKVEFRGKAGEQVSGNFAIDYTSANLTAASTAEADKVVTTQVGKTLSDEVTDIFVVVPAGEYASGFSVRLIDSKGHYMDIATDAITLTKGDIKTMPVIEFVPTATLIGIEIASAEELVAFAKAYNASEYANVTPLVVSLKNDIVFDDATNAAWTSIGRVAYEADGAVNHYFNGAFYGQGFAIKNWRSNNKPLFATTYDAIIKDLTINSTSSMTFSLNIIAESHYGVIVGDAFSTVIENCTNEASVVLDNCVADGLAVRLDVGGIVGRTDADCQVVGCTNNGTIESKDTCNFGLLADNEIPEAIVCLGGICGYSRCSLVNCSNTGDITSNYNAYERATAGIVARITGDGYVDGCTNEGAINDASRRNPIVDMVYDHNRNVRLAGIAAVAACNVTNCANSGDITTSTGAKSADIAGILAFVNSSNLDLSGNSNTGDININAPVDDVNTSGTPTTGIRYLFAGGLIGNSNNMALADLDCTGKTFSGTINIATVEGATSTTVAVGGVVGGHTKTDASLWTIQNVSYTGRITLSNLVNCAYCHLGGVVGRVCSPTHIKKATNSGAVECKGTNNIAYKDVCFGGILGANLDGVATTITESTNSGTIQFQNNTNISGRATAVGGIAGALTGAASTIQLCTNTGYICSHNRSNNNTAAIRTTGSNFGGGIVGFIQGTSDAKATIDQCTVNKTDSSVNSTITMATIPAGYGIYASRGILGGMVGYASHTNISNCNCSATIEKTQQGYVAALVAWLENSTIEECTVTASKVKADYANIAGRGSLAGKVVASVVKNNEVSFALEGTAASGGGDGVLAGISDDASTFTNNAVSGTFFGAAITLDSKMIGSGTPTISGTALYTE